MHPAFVPALAKKDPDTIFHVDGVPALPHSFKKGKVSFRADYSKTLRITPLYSSWYGHGNPRG